METDLGDVLAGIRDVYAVLADIRDELRELNRVNFLTVSGRIDNDTVIVESNIKHLQHSLEGIESFKIKLEGK